MEILDTDHGIFFDVDGTLVDEHENPNFDPKVENFGIKDELTGQMRFFTPRKRNIELLKTHFYRGFNVVVWSAGGVTHAVSIIKALGLQDLVKYTMCKPIKVCDDLSPNQFLSTNIFLKEFNEN